MDKQQDLYQSYLQPQFHGLSFGLLNQLLQSCPRGVEQRGGLSHLLTPEHQETLLPL